MAVDPHAEIPGLRTALRDLVALSAIPAAWVGREPSAIAAGLADVLVGSLHLDFAFVRLCDPNGGAAVEVTAGNAWKAFPEWLQHHLAVVGQCSRKEIIPDVGVGVEPCRGIFIPIGVDAEGGLVAAACDRTDFPTEIDQLLLSVAANHAGTAFQNARLIYERKRAEGELRQARNELELKVAERTAELRRSEAYLAEAQRLTHTGSWAWDIATGEKIHASAEYARLFGFDPEQGMPSFEAFRQRIHPEDRARAGEILDGAIRERADFEWDFRAVLPNGTLKYIHAVAHPVLNASGDLVEFVGTHMDVTERKQAEAQLRESEQRYRYIFESTGVSIWEEDFSQVKAAIDDLKSKGVRDFREYLAAHPEFVQQAITMVRIVDVNDVTVKLFAAESKNDLLVSLHKVFVPETQEVFAGELIAIAEGQRSFAAETFLQTLKGERLTALFTVTFPPPPARFDSVLVTVTDITERKRTEESLRQSQAELAHVTRVTTLGELTASIAHEINQPLAAIVADANASLNWLAAAPPDLDVVREALAAIVQDGHRAADVIQRIRQLASKTEPHKARLDVNNVIRDVVPLVRTAVLSHRVSLRVDLASALPPVLGDRVQLQQVLINLVMNGVEAMASVGARPPELVIRSRPHGGDQVLVDVQDAGVGIDPNTIDRLFHAFFTTKPGGLGMGLSISRSIIDAHGGRLWATPNPTHGATFHFALPGIQ
jgi:PAS domain S-box-containing protein